MTTSEWTHNVAVLDSDVGNVTWYVNGRRDMSNEMNPTRTTTPS